MKKPKLFSSLLIIYILLAACSPTPASEPEKASVPTQNVTSAPSEMPTATIEPETPTAVQEDEPLSEERQLPILEGVNVVYLNQTRVEFTQDADIQTTIDDYNTAMALVNCIVGGETGGENGATAILYICLDDEGAVETDTAVVFTPYEDSTNVTIIRGYNDTVVFNPATPEGAENLEETGAGASFVTTMDISEIYSFYESELGAINCTETESVGSPEGNLHYGYICSDENDKANFRISLLLSISEEQTSVVIEAQPLKPRPFSAVLPAPVESIALTSDGDLTFQSSMSLADLASFYRSEMDYKIDCQLVGETGGAGDSTAARYLCTDFLSAIHTYQYSVTIVISAQGDGSAGLIIYGGE